MNDTSWIEYLLIAAMLAVLATWFFRTYVRRMTRRWKNYERIQSLAHQRGWKFERLSWYRPIHLVGRTPAGVEWTLTYHFEREEDESPTGKVQWVAMGLPHAAQSGFAVVSAEWVLKVREGKDLGTKIKTRLLDLLHGENTQDMLKKAVEVYGTRPELATAMFVCRDAEVGRRVYDVQIQELFATCPKIDPPAVPGKTFTFRRVGASMEVVLQENDAHVPAIVRVIELGEALAARIAA